MEYKVGQILLGKSKDGEDVERKIVVITENFVQVDDNSIYDKETLHLRAGDGDACKNLIVKNCGDAN